MTKQEILNALIPYVLAVIGSVATALFGWLVKTLRAKHLNTTILEAVGRAAGTAYMELVKSKRLGEPVSVHDAVTAGIGYMWEQIPNILRKAGVTPEEVANMVNGELGKLLAQDASVSSGVSEPTTTVIRESPAQPPSGDRITTITEVPKARP